MGRREDQERSIIQRILAAAATGAAFGLLRGLIGYNPRAGRYVDLETGRFIDHEEVFGVVDQAVETFKTNAQDFIIGAIAAQVAVEVVQRFLMQEVKLGYIQTYVAGRGGRALMTPRDWGIVGRVIRDKYDFVQNFMRDIAGGRISEAELLARWDLYFENMVQGYWKGDQEAQIRAGKREMRRTLNSSVPCKDCPRYSGFWAAIGELPLPTEQCECRARCLCTVEYR